MVNAQDPGINPGMMREYLEYLSRTGLPFGSPMVFVPGGDAAGLRAADRMSENIRTLREAIREGLQVEAHYRGHRRLFCPHVLGYSRRGNLNVLAYQFGGTSSSRDIAAGSPDNWRCFGVGELEAVGTHEGAWHSAPMASDKAPSCVVYIQEETDHPGARHREWVNPDTGEVSRVPRVPWDARREAAPRCRPEPLSPPPHVIAALGAVHTELIDLTHGYNRTSYKVVYEGAAEGCPDDFSEVPAFNTLCVRLPDDPRDQYEAFDVAMRFIKACRPWVFILESDRPIPDSFQGHVWTEARILDYAVRSAAQLDQDENGLRALIGDRGA